MSTRDYMQRENLRGRQKSKWRINRRSVLTLHGLSSQTRAVWGTMIRIAANRAMASQTWRKYPNGCINRPWKDTSKLAVRVTKSTMIVPSNKWRSNLRSWAKQLQIVSQSFSVSGPLIWIRKAKLNLLTLDRLWWCSRSRACPPSTNCTSPIR